MVDVFHIASVFVIFGLSVAMYIGLSLTTQMTTKELNRLEATKHPTWLVWIMIIPVASVVIQYFALIRHIAKPIKKYCEQSNALNHIRSLIYVVFIIHIAILILAVMPVTSKSIDIAVSVLLFLQFSVNIGLIFKLNRGYKILKCL